MPRTAGSDGGAGVEVAQTDNELVGLLWDGVDREVPPAQARQIAAWLVEAAEMAEAAST